MKFDQQEEQAPVVKKFGSNKFNLSPVEKRTKSKVDFFNRVERRKKKKSQNKARKNNW